ncbi:uncharacterized protein FIESC28_07281 [Fusarium coffeatum]|uniref:Major facilitator superfamily (MFS) profile domain-containing protein n=1 Tax=Fusarium coffeatum TaxID=231269 RepID=A0A366RGY6_9HYPO|nr:uncharacterized protein FIESC28_07281 [Fusarium coffeatum]RBR15640.1 hypothetical protein FIESC28_07281 [Fusarium coffeatum]
MAELTNLEPISGHHVRRSADEQEAATPTPEPEINYPTGLSLWLIMLSVSAVLILSSIEMNIIATAIPSITDHFHTVAHIGWYSSAFRLCVCAFQFIFGKAYTLFSVKRIFLLANAISIVGSIVSGAATSSTMLVIGRAVAGLGSAGLFAGCFVIVVQSTPLRRRPVFLGVMGAVEGLATIAAPVLGGALQRWSWRWCFYINAPTGFVTFLLTMFCLSDVQKPAHIARLTLKQKVLQLDLVSNMLLLPALTSLFLAFSWAGTKYSWSSGEVIGPLVTFAIFLIAFVMNQTRRGETAALPPRLMKYRSVIAGFIFIFCVNSTGVVLEYYLPTYYQLVRGYSPVKSGYMILPIIIAATIGSLIHGAGTTAFGYYTPFMILASVIMPIAAGLITTFEIDTSFARLISYTGLSGLAYGIGFIGPQTAVQTVLPAEDVPLGLSIMLFAQSFGPAVAVPIAQVLFTNQLSTNLENLVPSLSQGNITNIGLTEMVASVTPSETGAVLVAINKSLGQTCPLTGGICQEPVLALLTFRYKASVDATISKPAFHPCTIGVIKPVHFHSPGLQISGPFVTRYVDVAHIMAMSKLAAICAILALGRYATAQSTRVNLPACGLECLSRVLSISEFAKQSSAQLCENFEFVQAINTCVATECNDEERQVVKDAAIKQCDIPLRDSRSALRGTTLIIFVIALLCFCLRLLSKILHRSNWGADDTFMSLAAFLIVPLLVLMQLMISQGLGLDIRMLDREQIVLIFKMFFFQQVTYFITLGFVKGSVLAFYLRIFPDHKFRRAVWITQFINLTTAFIYVILILVQKNPIALNWNGASKFSGKSNVLDDKLLYLTHGSISLALDVWMLILPITQVYHLGLKLRKKIGVIAMFSCGVLLTCAGVIRFYYLIRSQVARSAQVPQKLLKPYCGPT